ncbi:MAG: 4-hydroxythreonine-4-phosphate dehydrogenase PdxA [Planctomycetota bacterium]
MRKRRIVITTGDPAGIGPEIVLKVFTHKRVRESAHFVVLGNHRVMEETARRLEIPFPFERSRERRPTFGEKPVLVESDRMGSAPLLPGRGSVRTGRASLAYIFQAVHLCRERLADAMVTGPISKAAIQKAGCRYPGHTELIADLTGAEKVVMMLVGGGLRVALVTTHASLAAVPQIVTRGEIFATILVTHRELRESFHIQRPRIGVLGLNPHAGEDGLFGPEEKRHILPAMKEAARKGAPSVGPLPADSAFHRMLAGEFDVLVAMYHDQGLGPLKTVAFDTGVNVTLGLPIVRTSVDHGTAFDIAGKGVASERSLVAAIAAAAHIARARALGVGR